MILAIILITVIGLILGSALAVWITVTALGSQPATPIANGIYQPQDLELRPAEDSPGPGAVSPTDTKASGEAAAKLGQPVRVGELTITVTRVEPGAHLKEPVTNAPKQAQGQWVLVHISAVSRASKPLPLLGAQQLLVDNQGRSFRQDAQAANYNMGDLALVIKPINPGQTVTGALVYDVPGGAVPAFVELHDSAQAQSPAVRVSLSS